jgi:translation initiation factor 1
LPDDRRLVYSTDGSLPLPSFRAPTSKPKGRPQGGIPDDGIVRVGCERRKGGVVTLVYGLQGHELPTVAQELKRRCGTGGTAKNGVVELQGDRRDAALAFFAERGRRAKRMGG